MLKSIFLLVCLNLFLTSCGSTKYIKVKPVIPPEVLSPIEKPVILSDSTEALVEAYKKRGEAINQCNRDKGVIREALK